MHDQLARAHERRSEGDEPGAADATRSAEVLEESARAAAYRIEAAERRPRPSASAANRPPPRRSAAVASKTLNATPPSGASGRA